MSDKQIERSMRHGTYVVHPSGEEDVVFVKEYTYFPDGKVESSLKPIVNFERSFYVTKPGFRNHKDKKDSEFLDRLREFKTTQHNLTNAVAKALNYHGRDRSLRGMASSNVGQYLYGTDISTVSLIKNAYDKQWPNRTTRPASYAAYDIETDMLKDRDVGYTIMASAAYDDHVWFSVTREFAERHNLDEDSIRTKARELAPDYFTEDGETPWKLYIHIAENEGEVNKWVIERMHEVGPDYIGVWNIDFDLPKVIASFERSGIDPASVLSDPSVPEPYKQIKYNKGMTKRITASGREMTLTAAEQWHTLTAPAKFQWLCAMSVNAFLNVHLGKRPMGLDAVLQRELGTSKLKPVDIGEPEGSAAWHIKMQRHYGAEYCVYNIFDTIRVVELDRKTNDISRSVPSQLGISELSKFRSTPGKIVDDMEIFSREVLGMALASMPRSIVTDLDRFVTSARDWTITLGSYLMESSNMPLFVDAPHLRTRVYRFNFDLDVEGTYPNLENGLNLGKSSNRFEVSRIQGVSETLRRYVGVDLTLPETNAVWLATILNKAPTINQVLNSWSKNKSTT